MERHIVISLKEEKPGISYDAGNRKLIIDTNRTEKERFEVTLLADDNIMQESCTIQISIEN